MGYEKIEPEAKRSGHDYDDDHNPFKKSAVTQKKMRELLKIQQERTIYDALSSLFCASVTLFKRESHNLKIVS